LPSSYETELGTEWTISHAEDSAFNVHIVRLINVYIIIILKKNHLQATECDATMQLEPV